MALSQFVASYLMSSEGHTPLEAVGWETLHHAIKLSDMEEIITQANVLTAQRLWNDAISIIFSTEIYERISEDTTFVLSFSPEDVVAYIGFDDGYFIPDDDFLHLISSDLFTDELVARIAFMFIGDSVEVLVEQDSITLSNLQDTVTLSINLPDSYIGTSKRVVIRERPDFNVVKRVYLSLIRGEPEIIDTHADKLINQLIDYEEAVDIKFDNGFTFEGDVFLYNELEEDE